MIEKYILSLRMRVFYASHFQTSEALYKQMLNNFTATCSRQNNFGLVVISRLDYETDSFNRNVTVEIV